MNAGRMWFQILLDVLSHENEHWGDGQLLSHGADRLVERFPLVGRIFILGVGIGLTLHLANVLPMDHDPVQAQFWTRIARRGYGLLTGGNSRLAS